MTTDNLTDMSAGTSTPIDRDKLKIASFRTKEGVWADFTAAANKIGLTATDVIKAAMEQFIAGEYIPAINTGIHTHVNTQSGITRDEIQQLIDTAVSTAVSMAINTSISTSVSTETIESSIMTAISTVSLLTDEDVSTAINTALVPLRDEIEQLKQAFNNRVGSSEMTAPTPSRRAIEAVDLEIVAEASWGAFHQAVGLESSTSNKSAELGNVAIAKAVEMGFTGWTFSSNKQRFYRNSP